MNPIEDRPTPETGSKNLKYALGLIRANYIQGNKHRMGAIACQDLALVEICIGDAQGEIENLERQKAALREALEGMLSEFNEHSIPGIVHDELAVIEKARATLAATKPTQ